jgi:hypothetical protein
MYPKRNGRGKIEGKGSFQYSAVSLDNARMMEI